MSPIFVACSHCERFVRAQNMMGKPLRSKDWKRPYKATSHGGKFIDTRCPGSGKPAQSASNMALSDAQKTQLEEARSKVKVTA